MVDRYEILTKEDNRPEIATKDRKSAKSWWISGIKKRPVSWRSD